MIPPVQLVKDEAKAPYNTGDAPALGAPRPEVGAPTAPAVPEPTEPYVAPPVPVQETTPRGTAPTPVEQAPVTAPGGNEYASPEADDAIIGDVEGDATPDAPVQGEFELVI